VADHPAAHVSLKGGVGQVRDRQRGAEQQPAQAQPADDQPPDDRDGPGVGLTRGQQQAAQLRERHERHQSGERPDGGEHHRNPDLPDDRPAQRCQRRRRAAGQVPR
jgi:hypothetical protein